MSDGVHRHPGGRYDSLKASQGCDLQSIAGKVMAAVPDGCAAIVIVLDMNDKGHAVLRTSITPDGAAFVMEDMAKGLRDVAARRRQLKVAQA